MVDASTDSVLQETPDRQLGLVKWFDNKAGWGFILMPDNTDLFAHHSALCTAQDQFRYLVEGEYVHFNTVMGSNGKVTASEVSGPNRGPLMCETRMLRAQEMRLHVPSDVEENESTDPLVSEGGKGGKGSKGGKGGKGGKGSKGGSVKGPRIVVSE